MVMGYCSDFDGIIYYHSLLGVQETKNVLIRDKYFIQTFENPKIIHIFARFLSGARFFICAGR